MATINEILNNKELFAQLSSNEQLFNKVAQKVVTEGAKFIAEEQLPQGSQEWLAWRDPSVSVSATDMAVVLSGNHYSKTPYMLWCEKTGFTKPEPFPMVVVQAMQKGSHDEPLIRAFLNEKEGRNYIPWCVESKFINNLKCSLDGYDEKSNTILEIKSVSEKRFLEVKEKGATAVKGYICQIYWQLCLSGAEMAILAISLVKGEGETIDVIPIEIKLEEEKRIEILKKGLIFLNQVLTKTPPAEGYKKELALSQETINDSVDELLNLYESIKRLEDKIKKLKGQQDDLLKIYKEEMLEKGIDKMHLPFGFEFSKTVRKGSVDYQKFLKDKDIVLTPEEEDNYRKPSSTTWSLKKK